MSPLLRLPRQRRPVGYEEASRPKLSQSLLYRLRDCTGPDRSVHGQVVREGYCGGALWELPVSVEFAVAVEGADKAVCDVEALGFLLDGLEEWEPC